jgi:hypothetical protein
MAATKRNAMLIAEARQKIQTSQLINRLQDHALGKVEMSKSQVSATAILLRKTLPDLSENQNLNFSRRLADLTDDELIGLLTTAASEGDAEPADGSPQLN